MKLGAIILAGGQSTRFQQSLKQHLVLKYRTVTEIVVQKALAYTPYVVVSGLDPEIQGGSVQFTRACKDKGLSILTALELLELSGVDTILLMEAARPFVSKEHIERILAQLKKGSEVVVSGIVPVETTYIQTISGPIDIQLVNVLDRSICYEGQTPEGWAKSALRDAIFRSNAMNQNVSFSYAALAPYKPGMVFGDRFNFKITFPDDYLRAKMMVKQHKSLLW